jgi:hypothetical protein
MSCPCSSAATPVPSSASKPKPGQHELIPKCEIHQGRLEATDPFDFANALQVLRARLRLLGGKSAGVRIPSIGGNRRPRFSLGRYGGLSGASILLFNGRGDAPSAPAKRLAVWAGAEGVVAAVMVGAERKDRGS